MCNCWKEKSDYLNSSEIIAAVGELKSWLGNTFIVHIAGGESLIFDGIYDIFSFCAANGIVCKVSTNGMNLTENTCDKLIRSQLHFLSVSLDSHLADIHDRFRGMKGTLERSLKGIDYLAEHSTIKLGISSIIMRDNVSTLCDSVDFFLTLPISRLLFQPIRVWTENATVDKWRQYRYWVNDIDALTRFSKHLLMKKQGDARIFNTEKDVKEWIAYFTDPTALVEENEKRCTLGYDRLSINYKGEIYLGCEFYSSIGNIKRDNLRDAWHSPEARKVRKQMRQCELPCTNNCYKELTLLEKIDRARIIMNGGLARK